MPCSPASMNVLEYFEYWIWLTKFTGMGFSGKMCIREFYILEKYIEMKCLEMLNDQ